MVTTHHLVDHQRNILYLDHQKNDWCHEVIGLPPDYRKVKHHASYRDFGAATICENQDAAIPKALGSAFSKELKDLVTGFREVFKEQEGVPSDHRAPGFGIRLKPGTEPPHLALYCLTVKEKETYNQTIEQLLAKRHICP